MFLTIFGFTSCFLFTGLYFYKFQRKVFDEFMLNFGWNVLCIKTYIEYILKTYFNISVSGEPVVDTCSKFFIVDNELDSTTVSVLSDGQLEKVFNSVKKSMDDDTMVIYKPPCMKYLRIGDNTKFDELTTMEPVENPFFNVSVHLNDDEKGTKDEINITESIKLFYVKNNKLFDRIFMKWFMATFYDIMIEDDYPYIVEVIDSNFETLQFHSNNDLTNNIIL